MTREAEEDWARQQWRRANSSIVPPLNVKTARSWRGIVPFTHLAREGRMTVTIGRRELLVAFGGAAAWPLAARAQQPAKKMLRIGTVSALQQSSPTWAAFMRRMAELGYQEGKNFAFDFVSAANEDDFETGYRRSRRADSTSF